MRVLPGAVGCRPPRAQRERQRGCDPALGAAPTGARAVQGGLRALQQLHGAVGRAAVHRAVVRPALVDGGDVQVRGHRRAQLLSQLAVLAGVRTPQAYNQQRERRPRPMSVKNNRAVMLESFLFQPRKGVGYIYSYKDLFTQLLSVLK